MKNKQKKIKKGVVVNNKMNKTAVVAVSRFVKHKRYEKKYIQIKKYKAHDENKECKIGDRVLIQECRPFSKTKNWKMVKKL